MGNENGKFLATLPFFEGFYNSSLSGAVDSYEEREAEWMSEKECSQEHEPDTYQPEHLRISASEYCELFFECCNYRNVYLKVAQFWVEAFDLWCKENLGTPEKSFVWESMSSPREYNFTTDRVFAHVPEGVVRMLFDRSAKDGHKVLAQVIKDTFTSYDGFMSFYSNSIEAWLEKPLEKWDHNEVGTLIAAAIKASGECHSRGEFCRAKFSMELYEATFSGNNEEGDAFDAGMDWEKFERLKAELRDKKAEEAQSAV